MYSHEYLEDVELCWNWDVFLISILSDDSDTVVLPGLLDVALRSTGSCCCADGEVGWCCP